jgi:glycosyltransferase involved in cell wall biosynthesis
MIHIQNPNIIIVMPAYNAAKTLKRTYNEIPLEYRKKIILVDDCSSDNTVDIARELSIEVICHAKNQGYGGNQKTCYTQALRDGADIVVMVHPDHQYDATVIPHLIQPLMNTDIDAAFGSRMLGGRPMDGGMPRYKYIANVFLTAIANIVFQRYLTEIHSGFRAYTRKYLETVRYEENSNNFVFDTEIIAQGMACNLFFTEVPITTRYFEDASSINFFHSLVYGFSILGVLLRYLLHRLNIIHFRQFLPVKDS